MGTSSVAVLALLATGAGCSASSKPASAPIVNVAPPGAVDEPEGVELVTKIVDSVSDWPIEGAVVRVLPSDTTAEPLELGRLDRLAVTRATSDAKGVARFAPRIPAGTYSVVVIADGYKLLVGERELTVPEGTKSPFDPWGHIWLQRR